jgi:hypothetical protein
VTLSSPRIRTRQRAPSGLSCRLSTRPTTLAGPDRSSLRSRRDQLRHPLRSPYRCLLPHRRVETLARRLGPLAAVHVSGVQPSQRLDRAHEPVEETSGGRDGSSTVKYGSSGSGSCGVSTIPLAWSTAAWSRFRPMVRACAYHEGHLSGSPPPNPLQNAVITPNGRVSGACFDGARSTTTQISTAASALGISST